MKQPHHGGGLPSRALLGALAAVGLLLIVSVSVASAQSTDPSVAAKTAYEARLDAMRQRAIAEHPRAPKSDATPQPTQETRLRTGLFDTHQGWFSPSEFVISNGYHGPIAGETYAYVYAGGKRVHPSSADQSTVPALRIYQETANGQGGFAIQPLGNYQYALPGGTSRQAALRITSVAGTVLEVRAADGTLAHFDLATLSWTS